MNSKKYSYFIGIDISRNKLDLAVMRASILLFHREIANTPDEIKNQIAEFKTLPKFTIGKTIFCMEHTGIYGNHFLAVLKRLKANVVIEPSVHIKNSLGNIRGKSDKIDAVRIAEYAYRSREALKLWLHKRPVIEQLAQLTTIRERLLGLRIAIQTPLKEETGFVKKKVSLLSKGLCTKSADALEEDLRGIDQLIAEVIHNDEPVSRLMKIITSVAGIGPVTALMIIICTNEFKNIRDPKKFACYAGVAPFIRESGKLKGRAKVSHLANKRMKALLHLCAMSARTRQPEIKAFYFRKTQVEGKSKMSVINAIRYKLILRVFACVNQNRYYEKNRPESPH